MELAAHTLSYCPNLSKSPTFSPSSSPTFIHHPNNSLFVHTSPPLLSFCTFPKALQLTNPKTGGRLRSFGALHASETEIPSAADAERWLLEPVGDGDSRHIGFKVPMPNSFEIASSTVTIGRLPEKADLVIPVATVSGLHARIVKKEGSLLVTDLDSTNGTFIDDKRLRPGDAAPAFPGSCVIFGDTHLAMFRVSKLEIVEAPSQSDESDARMSSETSSEAIG